MENSKKNFIRKRGMLILFILLIVVFFIYIYVLPDVSDAFKATDIIEYGGIQTKEAVTCYIVRNESVYTATAAGAVRYYAEEGEQVRIGTKILDIAEGAVICTAEKRGMISYCIDGREAFFTPDRMKQLQKADADESEAAVNNLYGREAAPGEPLYKIVDGDIWYAVMWIGRESIIKYEKGSTVSLLYNGSEINGTIDDIVENGEDFLVILKFDRYWKDMPKVRKIEAEVVTADYKGLMVRNESITAVDGIKGVYVRDVSGNFLFKPVRVMTSDGRYSLVECGYYYDNADGDSKRIETVDIYDEVLRNGKPE